MKALYGILVMALLVMAIVPMVMATDVNTGITPTIETEDFAPRVWMCDRDVYDDAVEPGIIDFTDNLIERVNNYAFEGESIVWEVLVMDKNGAEKIKDVFATIGDSQGEGNDIEVNCQEVQGPGQIPSSCNARLDEEQLYEFDSDVMQYYECTLTVETAESMYGEYWVTVEALDMDDLSGTMDENEYWYFNPVIGLSVEGDLTFENVRPGTDAYSDTLLLSNDADDDSGVMLDMYISGTDFYDSSSSGAMCPTTNQLNLDNFGYFATAGFYSTAIYPANSNTVDGDADAEGYRGIPHGNQLVDTNAIMTGNSYGTLIPPVGYALGNVLQQGEEMALTFKLSLPEPCNGDFDSGTIEFWGEAI